MAKKQKFLKKNIIILLILLILFLLIRIPILFTFKGILGGNESYEINRDIKNLLKGSISYLWGEQDVYKYFTHIFQIPFTLPFYLLFPTNEFSSFLGTTLTSIIILAALFLFLNKYFNKKIAIISSLIFIISPIGFTISTLAQDSTGNNLILLSLILFFFVFFNKNKKIRYWSMILLAFLPIIHPYHFILWSCCAVYLLLESHFQSKKGIIDWKYLKPYLIFFLIAAIIFSPVYSAISKNALMRGKIFYPESISLVTSMRERVNDYLPYFKRLFIPSDYIFFDNIFNMEILEFVSYTSLFIFLILLMGSMIYFIFESIKRKKITPILIFAIYPLFFVLSDLFLYKRFASLAFRTLSISTHYLKILFFMSIILISCFAYHKKIFRIMVYAFILLNLMMNISAINSLNESNNFVTYNLGNEDNIWVISTYNELPEVLRFHNIILTKEQLDVLNDTLINCLMNGYGFREVEIRCDNDFVLFGFGVKLFYNNSFGINLCNRLYDENKTNLCKKGYAMTEKEFKVYLNKKQIR